MKKSYSRLLKRKRLSDLKNQFFCTLLCTALFGWCPAPLWANHLAASASSFTLTTGQPLAVIVSGTVTDDSGSPLPGVNVLVKGSSYGTSTDNKGQYSLSVEDPNAVLVFSFIGYTTEEVPLKGRTSIDVKLMPDIRSLSEVVVMGYGKT
jgi:hypothetical protein